MQIPFSPTLPLLAPVQGDATSTCNRILSGPLQPRVPKSECQPSTNREQLNGYSSFLAPRWDPFRWGLRPPEPPAAIEPRCSQHNCRVTHGFRLLPPASLLLEFPGMVKNQLAMHILSWSYLWHELHSVFQLHIGLHLPTQPPLTIFDQTVPAGELLRTLRGLKHHLPTYCGSFL
jgi:hypothetical protein